MKSILVVFLGVIMVMGSCKKEECPEPQTPYYSTMKGVSSTGLRFIIRNPGTNIPQGCNGWFIQEVTLTGQNREFLDFNIQVVEGLSDSIKQWNNYNQKEFIIDFEFIGTGYECKYVDGLTEYIGDPVPVEQVKIINIEPI